MISALKGLYIGLYCALIAKDCMTKYPKFTYLGLLRLYKTCPLKRLIWSILCSVRANSGSYLQWTRYSTN